jgi:hypothetical protein
MEKYPYCTSKEFKTDLSELCEQCPLKEKIQQGIQDQIVFQAEEKKRIYTESQFTKYVTDEISSAEKSMNKVFLLEKQQHGSNDGLRKNRIETYIWNKERIKALNKHLGYRRPSKIYSWVKRNEKLITIILSIIGLIVAVLALL